MTQVAIIFKTSDHEYNYFTRQVSVVPNIDDEVDNPYSTNVSMFHPKPKVKLLLYYPTTETCKFYNITTECTPEVLIFLS